MTPKEALNIFLQNIQDRGITTGYELSPEDLKIGNYEINYTGGFDQSGTIWNWGDFTVKGPEEVTEKGVKAESLFDFDPNLNLKTYRTVYKTGGDSGVVVDFDAGGNIINQRSYDQSEGWKPFVGNALAIFGTLALGPAGTGLFSAPVAAAASTGVGTLVKTGSIEDALKAAALAGASVYGFQELINPMLQAAFDTAFAAADAAQLANQGLDAAAIAQNLSTYVDPTLAASLANTAASQSEALTEATRLLDKGFDPKQVIQILEDGGFNTELASSVTDAASQGVTSISASDIVPNLQFQPQTGGQTSQLPRLPDSIEISGQRLIGQPLDFSTLGSGLLTVPTLPTIPTIAAPIQTTTVEAPRVTTETPTPVIPGLLTPAIAAPVTPTAPEQVEVQEKRVEPEQPVTVTPVVLPTTQPVTTPATEPQRVEVETKREPPRPDDEFALPVPPIQPPAFEVPIPEVKINEPTKLPISTSDLLKLIGLIGAGGGAGMLGGGGTTIGSIPPSDTMLGSTTPQFGPDYYAAVQQYYNAYMPETPRNVAGPLQQWYENKYGA